MKSGDYLWKIANTYGTSVEELKLINGLQSDLILVVQKLRVTIMYKVVPADTLWSLSQSFNSTVQSIKTTNGLTSNIIYIGQKLTTFPDGKIAVCRPFNTPPEGSLGLQNKSAMLAIESDSLAIENVGNFDIGYDVMTEEQKETIVDMTALLCIKFGLTPSINTITYHHWWDINTGEKVLDNSAGHSVKTCPGTWFFGGNSTKSAVDNLYPLILRRMQEILKSTH